eukprot:4860828-Pleurochrysis_carterae.AAC.1
MVSPIRRVMPLSAVAKTRSRSEPSVQQPENPKSLVVYDFPLDELLARLVEHCPTAREAIYDT